MATGPAPENAGLQIERFCHPAFDALERMSAQLGSCNLDGERNAIEICTNPLDDGKLIRCWLKPSISQSGPFYEQTNCRGMPRPIMRAGIQRGDLVDGLALYPKRAPAGIDQEQLATGRTEFGDCIRNRIEHVLTVVHEQDRTSVVQTFEDLDSWLGAGHGQNQQGLSDGRPNRAV